MIHRGLLFPSAIPDLRGTTFERCGAFALPFLAQGLREPQHATEGDVMRQQGFSLIELLMGLAITGIVLQLVSPAFATLIESNQREQAAQALFSGIRTARTEAIVRNQAVVIHSINGDWSHGWRMILDISGKGEMDSDNPLLAERQGNARVSIVGNGPVESSIRFRGQGESLIGGTLHICAVRKPVSQHQVVLARTGRVSLRSDKAEHALCEERQKLRATSERAVL
jgi:type IV fimbrial biogenesis protein FimT